MNGKGGSYDLTEAFAWRKNVGMGTWCSRQNSNQAPLQIKSTALQLC